MPDAPDCELISRAVVAYCREMQREEPHPDLSASGVRMVNSLRYVVLRTERAEPLVIYRWTNQSKLKYLRRPPAELYGEGD